MTFQTTTYPALSMQAESRPAVNEPTSAGTSYSGLLGASALQARLAQEWERARTFRRPIAVMLVRTLQRGELGAAQQAVSCLNELQATARVGLYDRHSLLAVLPETNPDNALQIARTFSVRVSGHGRIACGVAVYPDAALSLARLVGAAERAARRASVLEPIVLAPTLPAVREPHDQRLLLSPALAEIERAVQEAAGHDQTVLLVGEAGSGRQTLALRLNAHARASGPLKILHCAALEEAQLDEVLFGHVQPGGDGSDRPGVFEQAQGGTLLLADVAELSAAAQAKLLAVLQSQRVRRLGASDDIPLNLQWVATTQRDLAALVAQGQFDRELLAKLSGAQLRVPALRERSADIVPLAEHFLASITARWGTATPRISDESRALLLHYAWPGNITELRSVIERAAALAEDETITPADLPEHLRARGASDKELRAAASSGGPILDLRASLQDHEAMLIRQALQLSRGNQRKAAGLLNLPLRTFERKLRNLGGRNRLMAS